jgi:transposase
VSVARLAQENGINANLLRKWIARHLLERGSVTSPAGPDARDIEGGPSRTIEGSGETRVGMPRSPMHETSVAAAQPAFVPVIAAPPPLPSLPPQQVPPCSPSSIAVMLHVRLPNGVEFDLGEANLEELATIVQMLGRMPCSGSTKA